MVHAGPRGDLSGSISPAVCCHTAAALKKIFPPPSSARPCSPEEDQDGPGSQQYSQGPKPELSQSSSTAAAAASAAAPSTAPPRLRGIYDPGRGGSALLAGPLSVNDPQLEPPGRGDRFILSESFFGIASPFGPRGAGNDWRVLRKDAPEHVRLLSRALMAAQDYAGAARSLATLHRLQRSFDPDVYRYTVALLRVSGNHQVGGAGGGGSLRR